MGLPAHALPDWPARMQAPLAAAYLGISQTKFALGVKDARYPKGVADGGNVVWHRRALDDWVETDRLGVEGSAGDAYDEALGDDSGQAVERP